ncbi:hypothetical protein [Pseudoxanthomonas sp. PXM04]|uniref:hypothetical protein n=1 Tax=Pseudoxanthomonas sp. PXM04 TaxID=2769297 RepID=UPI00177E176F|nr:hypothetical protein [Pseudoxanthomonas sp. PXM04]MBD9376171.1 hypothetical protein [Pseudoxanthomonas sp. PXM04]
MATVQVQINVVDQLGVSDVMVETTKLISVGTFDDPDATTPGATGYSLLDGTRVNKLSHPEQVRTGYEFQVVGTDRLLRRR